jgi:hypothetical protein
MKFEVFPLLCRLIPLEIGEVITIPDDHDGASKINKGIKAILKATSFSPSVRGAVRNLLDLLKKNGYSVGGKDEEEEVQVEEMTARTGTKNRKVYQQWDTLLVFMERLK